MDWFSEECSFVFVYLFSLEVMVFNYEIFEVIGVGWFGFCWKLVVLLLFFVVWEE